MAHLLSIPENVMIQQLFPLLDHNDLLRLRRVCKQTKTFADAYLWTPKQRHQGSWVLKIDSKKDDQKLDAFFQMDVPPPSRLHIANSSQTGPSEKGSFFENEHLEEFMRRYSKYVTHLRVDKLFFPVTSAKEIRFYESLVKLETLECSKIITVRVAARSEQKTTTDSGTLNRPCQPLAGPNWSNKLKIFKLTCTDRMDSMWTFLNGVSNNLEELLHPFQRSGLGPHEPVNFAPVQELIERRGGIESESKLVYDWKYLKGTNPRTENLDLLRVYASCRDHGVIIKNLAAHRLNCLICDENGRINKSEVIDPLTGEWIWNSRVNYRRNLFVGEIIHSLVGVTDNAFLMDMPALESISFMRPDQSREFKIRRKHGCGYPEWPNLKNMYVRLDNCKEAELRFLFEEFQRPNLEELSLDYLGHQNKVSSFLPRPRILGECCGNLKKLTMHKCGGDTDFFLGLWEALPLLEDVTLKRCWTLSNKILAAKRNGPRRPALLDLERLKHLAILDLDWMPKVTDKAFQDVFRHLKLASFKLSSYSPIKKITVNGIIKLFSGPFGETIEKLDLDKLQLENVSGKQLTQVVACFWPSKTL